MKPQSIFLPAVLSAALCVAARSAESIAPTEGLFTYSQNFDAMFAPAAAGAQVTTAAAGNNWQDNGTIPNWYFHYATNTAGSAGVFAGASFVCGGNDGTAGPRLDLNSMGAAGSTDRAFATPSTTARSEQSGIVVFQNNSARNVDLTRVRFNGEVRRTNSTADTVESVHVYWRLANTQAEALTITTENLTAADAATRYGTTEGGVTAGNFIKGWTEIPTAIFTYSDPNGAAAVNISTPIDANNLAGIRVQPGKFLAVRFSQPNGTGTDALMGIDDLVLDFAEVDLPAITATVGTVTRLPGDDPAIPTDDIVSISLNVSGAGGVAPAWKAGIAPSIYGAGDYGTPSDILVPISAFTAATRSGTITIYDDLDAAVTTTVDVAPPWTSYTITGDTITRLPGVDPASPVDDTVTFNLNVNGQFVSTGSGWTLTPGTITGLPASGAYSTPAASTEIPIPVLAAGTELPIAQIGPFTIADSLAPGSTSENIYLLPPLLIGTSTVQNTAPDVVSEPRLLIGDLNQVTYSSDPTPATRMLQMTDGDMGGAGTAAKLITSTMDLSGAQGFVKFSMRLTATDGSSGFEAGDTFAAQLILNNGMSDTTVNLVRPGQETVVNGILAGTELATGPVNGQPSVKEFLFEALIPDDVLTARLEIRAICESTYTSERMVIDRILYAPADPGIIASIPASVTHNEEGNGASDDTVSFTTTLTSIEGGNEWICTTPGVTPTSGAFGTVTFTVASPLGTAPLTVNFTATSVPGSIASIVVPMPAVRNVIGQFDFGGTPIDLPTSIPGPNSALWVNTITATNRSHTINAGVADQTETLFSQVLDISSVGDIAFSAKLIANDTSTGTNYDLPDKFKIELIIDGGLPTETTVNLVTPYDRGDGTPAVPFVNGAPVANGPPDGWINGYDATASAADGFAAGLDQYNAFKNRDEFNLNGMNAADAIAGAFVFRHLIPATASNVQLKISSQAINGSENCTLQNVLFTTDLTAADTDGDGMTDDYELQYGLNPASNADRLTDADGDGQSNYAEFIAGTSANDPASALRILNIVPAATANTYDVTFATVPGKSYRLQESTDLGNSDAWASIGTANVPADAFTETVSITIPAGDPIRFLRALVVLP